MAEHERQLKLENEHGYALLELAMIGYGVSHCLVTVRHILAKATAETPVDQEKQRTLVELFDLLIEGRDRVDPDIADSVIEAAFISAHPNLSPSAVREVMNALKRTR